MQEKENYNYPELDESREKCGVFGIYAPGEALAALTYEGLMDIQHRGQQGAGISVAGPDGITVYSDLGLVREVFARGKHLKGLPENATVATGHTWYGTAGTPLELQRDALMPMVFSDTYSESNEFDQGHEFSFSHNGNLVDLEDLASQYGIDPDGQPSDSALVKEIIGAEYLKNGNLELALQNILPRLNGAYSLVISTPDRLIAARDPQGFRPLHLGKLKANGWVVASEIPALKIVGAVPLREVMPGEIISINEHGITSTEFAEAKPAVCAFEFVYFSRPDNEIFGEVVLEVRERMGKMLAMRDSIQADVVLGVPESGLAAADGYSQERGIAHRRGLVKNNYVDRTFIAPTQVERKQGVRNKLNVIEKVVKDKSVIIFDDSIVRGTTQKEVVAMCREAGAREVHVRIASPPYKWPCFMGMDTGRRDELLASHMSIEEVCNDIGADTLMYVTNEELQVAVGGAAGKICTACTTGIYPTEVPVHIRDSIL